MGGNTGEGTVMNWTEDGLGRLADYISDYYKFPRERFAIDCLPDGLSDLSERERLVMYDTFEKKMSMRAIGEEFSVTAERIRQIKAKATRKLWNPIRQNRYIYKHPHEYQELREKYETLGRDHRELLDEYNSLLDCYVNNKKYDGGLHLSQDLNNLGIDVMEPSVRAFNCLYRAGIRTMYDLSLRTKRDLMNIRNLGARCLAEIISKAAEHGVYIREE